MSILNWTAPRALHTWYARAAEVFPNAKVRHGRLEDYGSRTHLPAVVVDRLPVFPPTGADFGLSMRSNIKTWYVVPLDDLVAFRDAGAGRSHWAQTNAAAKRPRQPHKAPTDASKPVDIPWPAPWTSWAPWGDAQLYTLRGQRYAVVGRGDQLGTVELPEHPVEPRRGFWRWQVPAADLEAFRKAWRAAHGQGWHTDLRRWAVPLTLAQRRWAVGRRKTTEPLPKAEGLGVRVRGVRAIRAAHAATRALPDLLPGMHLAYRRSKVPQLVRAPWPAEFAPRYTDLEVALYWTPAEGYALREADPAQQQWRLRDARWRAVQG